LMHLTSDELVSHYHGKALPKNPEYLVWLCQVKH
jgi:hypothetical protein